MKNKFIIFTIGILFFLSCKISKYNLQEDDFVFYDKKNNRQIALEENIEDVNNKLGEPIEKRIIGEPDKTNKGLVYTYDAVYENIVLQYSTYSNTVYWIRSINNPTYETKRGLKVGDSVSKVYKLYAKEEIGGEGKFSDTGKTYIFFEFFLPHVGWKDPSLQMYVIHDEKKIESIELQYSEFSY